MVRASCPHITGVDRVAASASARGLFLYAHGGGECVLMVLSMDAPEDYIARLAAAINAVPVVVGKEAA
jgi:hypothetical protein